ncbi:glycoside hydrolase family 130 protein [Cohnella sp. REN36]|uniref:glycoside hydrolase family 130 protein n=1 Tax=Cohnella sp. REN36 TaxID=2887347 RepID=UPI001D14FBC6|nr:glycoside hydrolase family 130 protein [Cohnella sp. REN36]MCC3371970.1 glycoside hydrolase family 130 protein [Cohnella sp. REN36]
MAITRFPHNPIIETKDVRPLRPDFQVVGVFNAGVATFRNEVILLLRIAEMPIQSDENHVLVPVLSETNGELEIIRITKSDDRYDLSDSRVIKQRGRYAYLTSLSYLRMARSTDGIHFKVDAGPTMLPGGPLEAWGIEDPRITQIGHQYFITYSAISSKGVSVGVAVTEDFVTFARSGVMLPPENKDVAIFPEKIGGNYYALHRPVPKAIGSPEMWLAQSPDLLHWGQHQFLIGLREGQWDGGRIGGGAVPIKTPEGWLVLYHGADETDRYCMGALLLDLKDPVKVIARSRVPVLEPEAEYEVNGFFGRVVFSCGAILLDRSIRMYYGAADEVMAGVDIPLEDIYYTLY